jgi:hypothetical protein
MEGLARLAPRVRIHTLSESERAKAIYRARMCYNHLAGTMLSEALVEKKILRVVDMGYIVEDEGIAWLENFGIPCQPLKKRGLLLVPWHIDWSERKHHVAGAFGTALAHRLFELKWIERQSTSRPDRERADRDRANFRVPFMSGKTLASVVSRSRSHKMHHEHPDAVPPEPGDQSQYAEISGSWCEGSPLSKHMGVV